jgi:hypothetical protein
MTDHDVANILLSLQENYVSMPKTIAEHQLRTGDSRAALQTIDSFFLWNEMKTSPFFTFVVELTLKENRFLMWEKMRPYKCTASELKIAIEYFRFEFFSCCETEHFQSLMMTDEMQSVLLREDMLYLYDKFICVSWTGEMLIRYAETILIKSRSDFKLIVSVMHENELKQEKVLSVALKKLWPIKYFCRVASTLRPWHISILMQTRTQDELASVFSCVSANNLRCKSLLINAIVTNSTAYFTQLTRLWHEGINDVTFDEECIALAVSYECRDFLNYVFRFTAYHDIMIDAIISIGKGHLLSGILLKSSKKRNIHLENVCRNNMVECIDCFDNFPGKREILIRHRLGMYSTTPVTLHDMELAKIHGDEQFWNIHVDKFPRLLKKLT